MSPRGNSTKTTWKYDTEIDSLNLLVFVVKSTLRDQRRGGEAVSRTATDRGGHGVPRSRSRTQSRPQAQGERLVGLCVAGNWESVRAESWELRHLDARFIVFLPRMDYPPDPKKRKVHAPNSLNPRGDVTARTLGDINAVLEEHARRIETLAAANKVLEGRNTALEERCKALDRKSESLERSCDKLKVRCSSLERSIQVLKKDVNWAYSAPSIPRSQGIVLGRDEDYANSMGGAIRHIKKDVERIRNGENIDCNCLDFYDQTAILHDDVLLPHFQELADAIQLSNGIQQINIDNIEMCPSALRILFPAMEGKVKRVWMESVTFPAEDVVECYEIIATSIRRNHALKELTWSGIRIPSDEQADLLIKSVIDNRSIKDIRLKNCFNQSGVNGCRALAALMTCGRPFDLLNFGGNGLSGIDDLAAALATNPQLERLWILDNQLNDRDADLIAQALKQNTNLQQLYLKYNGITSAGFEKIRSTIYDPSSMNAVESCNHTCWIDRVEGNVPLQTPLRRRNQKLYKLLSTRHADGSNALHLKAELGEDKYTIKLVPKVLHCIKRYSCDQTANISTLSITFELIKSWMMPELFEHH
ncbi:hypothetical protein THAOC_10011 [Thalassiosira oceanica]|uniref:Uncharacterized protein n=1 Tax=Thalassiosira oceanica TaxID=159749 RepID=K0TE12_THAOC|nr:hypothetical protein THAOC_10011 [Thalassiosira oceanica]|eukprot:EJK68782.1 hypothetical protein THAOC_10011 [Thalassiosira oceanica]